MKRVTVSYPSGATREILLAGVPRVGDHIRVKNGPDAPPLVVETVTWIEGDGDAPEPIVIITVRARAA